MILSTPIKRPKGLLVRLTQGFGERLEFYKPYGTNGHPGWDLVCGVFPEKSYGVQIINPLPTTARVVSADFESPLAQRGNRVILETDSIMYDGRLHIFQVVLAHLKSVEVKVGDRVAPGQLIGRMGNSGLVQPPPTLDCPYCGTHLHIELIPWWQVNGAWVLKYDNGMNGRVDLTTYLLDLNPPGLEDSTFTETNGDRDANEHNLDPLSWALAKLLEKVKSLKR